MIYNNLLFFLVAIILFSTSDIPAAVENPWWLSLLSVSAVLFAYYQVVRLIYHRSRTGSSASYFKAEKISSVLALFFFAATIYVCDIKYYFGFLSMGDRFPAFVNIAGLALFLSFFSILWWVAKKPYSLVFGRHYSGSQFVLSNIKSNLPIVLPWLLLSVFYDFIGLLPIPGLKEILTTGVGDAVFFGSFLLIVLLLFPPIVRVLWGCKKLPAGQLRSDLEGFCEQQKFSAELYLWPLFEGRVLTAGVMGIIPGLRYILLTPAIIENMTKDELEAVVAHEIGHVKKFHLILYVFLIGGFSVLMGFLAEPAIRVLFATNFLTSLMISSGITPDQMFTWLGTITLIICMVVFFRFIFGYFIRNFERQADLHVFSAIGDAKALISAFERLAVVSGDIRDKPSWHHFGIGERVDYLELCERDPRYIKKQNRKVLLSLVAYLFVLVLTVVLVGRFPTEDFVKTYEEKYTHAFLVNKIEKGSKDPVLLKVAGNYMVSSGLEELAVSAYEQALEIESASPELLNNLAWLLLTSKDLKLRNPPRAMTLARTAATLRPAGNVLDTLATAYWANGFVEEALATQKQAVFVDPEQAGYYFKRAKQFKNITYQQSLLQGLSGNGDS